jgi:hypothetical protein
VHLTACEQFRNVKSTSPAHICRFCTWTSPSAPGVPSSCRHWTWVSSSTRVRRGRRGLPARSLPLIPTPCSDTAAALVIAARVRVCAGPQQTPTPSPKPDQGHTLAGTASVPLATPTPGTIPFQGVQLPVGTLFNVTLDRPSGLVLSWWFGDDGTVHWTATVAKPVWYVWVSCPSRSADNDPTLHPGSTLV